MRILTVEGAAGLVLGALAGHRRHAGTTDEAEGGEPRSGQAGVAGQTQA